MFRAGAPMAAMAAMAATSCWFAMPAGAILVLFAVASTSGLGGGSMARGRIGTERGGMSWGFGFRLGRRPKQLMAAEST
jgi:hypothetical protein